MASFRLPLHLLSNPSQKTAPISQQFQESLQIHSSWLGWIMCPSLNQSPPLSFPRPGSFEWDQFHLSMWMKRGDTRVPLKEKKGMDGEQAITNRYTSAWTRIIQASSSCVRLGSGKRRNKEQQVAAGQQGTLQYTSYYPALNLPQEPVPILKTRSKGSGHSWVLIPYSLTQASPFPTVSFIFHNYGVEIRM